MSTLWKLIIDRVPLPGSLDMAVDEYLFRTASAGRETFIRFYRWERPTASLGFSQDVNKVLDLEFCRSNGVDVVRRITGGKLVLHWREVTYSVSSADTDVFTSTLADSYRLISKALIRGLERMGLEARLADAAPAFYARSHMPCFSYPARDEIEVGGKKMVGSAQKRIGSRFLQHGSIPLESDEELLWRISLLKDRSSGDRMTSLSQSLGRAVSFDEAVEHFAAGFAEFFGVSLETWTLPPDGLAAAEKIRLVRYGRPAWTLERRDGKNIDFLQS